MVDKIVKIKELVNVINENAYFVKMTLIGDREEACSQEAISESCIDDTLNIILCRMEEANGTLNKITKYLRGEK